MTKKEYIKKVAEEIWDKTEEQYKENMPYNFVILENGKQPVCWEDGRAVIYGSKEDYECDLQEGDVVITEQEYYNNYLD